MSDLSNRVVPSVWTQLINKISYNVNLDSDVVAFIGPAASGPLDTVLSYSNPSNALNELGSCRMTNQMFAAWAGRAGLIKTIRIGGAKTFSSVVYLDQDASPSDPYEGDTTTVAYDISTYAAERHNTLADFYTAIGGSEFVTDYDKFGGAETDVIYVFSPEKFDTMGLEFLGTNGGILGVAYYNGDESSTVAGLEGFTEFPLTSNGTEYLSGITLPASGAATLKLEWDVADISDWGVTSVTDSNEVAHSGYCMILYRRAKASALAAQTAPPGSPVAGDVYLIAGVGSGAWSTHDNAIATWSGSAWTYVTAVTNYQVYVQDEFTYYKYSGSAWVAMTTSDWDIKRIIRRLGAEPAFVTFKEAEYDDDAVGGVQTITGEESATAEVIKFEAKNASTDVLKVYLKRIGAKTITVDFELTDSIGRVFNESYKMKGAWDSDSESYEYVAALAAMVATINTTSTLVTATLLEDDKMFGWTADDVTVTESFTFSGASASDSDVSLKDYAYALAKLAREEDVYWVVPVIPEETVMNDTNTAVDIAKFDAIMDLFAGHVTNVSSGLNMRPRLLMSWLNPAYQNVGSISEENPNIETGSSRRLNSNSRVIYTVQKLAFVELESDSEAFRREYLASHLAGILSDLRPAVPGTRKPIVVGRVDETFDFDELSVLIRNGVLGLTKIPQRGVVIGKAITSDTSGSITGAITARRIGDRIALDTTAMLEARFIGRVLEPGLKNDITSALENYLSSKVGPAERGGLINGFSNIIVNADQSNPNKVLVNYDLDIKTDLDYIDQTIYLTTSLNISI